MVSPVNDFDIRLQAESPRTLAPRGGIILSATTNTILVDANGSGSPSIVTLVATPLVLTGSIAFTTSPTVPLTIDSTGRIATLHYSDMGASSVSVTVTLTSNGLTYSDSRTISPATIGSLGYTGALNATHNSTTQGPYASRPAGANGDFYFGTDTLKLYQNIGGSWVEAGNNFTNTNQLTDGANLGGTATWGGVWGPGKAADNASADLVLVGRNATVVGNTATKPSGLAQWDADAYSKDSFTGGAYASAMAVDSASLLMFGLNSDPQTDTSYTSIDYAVYLNGGGLHVYESGATAGYFGTYAAGDVLAVVYDGSSVRYLKNGTVLYTSTLAGSKVPNQTLFFDSALYSVGASLKNIRFGPLTSNNWTNIGGTGKPQDNANYTSASKGAALNDDPGIENTISWYMDSLVGVGTSAGGSAITKNYFVCSSGTNQFVYQKRRFPLDPAKTYNLTAMLYAAAGNDRDMYLYANFYDINGSKVFGSPNWGGSMSGYTFGTTPPGSDWSRQGGWFGAGTPRPIPSTVKEAEIGVWFQYGGTGTSQVQQGAQDIRIEDVTLAANALTQLTNIASDSVLSKGEKSVVIADWNVAVSERTSLDAQASALGVATTDYDNAEAALGSYLAALSPAYDDLTQDTTIVGTTFRSKWATYYDEKQKLINALAAKAATMATWNTVTGVGKPSDNASSDLVLIGRGMTITGNTVMKTGGTGGSWDADVYSVDSFTGGAYASAVAVDITSSCMFGLNGDPTANSSYTSLDYAIYFDTTPGARCISIYESNAYIATFAAWAVGDVFAVVYDGSSVRYMKNGSVFYTSVSAGSRAPNQILYFDSSFNNTGATLKNLRFGPMSSNNWSSIGNRPQDTTNLVLKTNFEDGAQGTWDTTALPVSVTGQTFTKALQVGSRDTYENNGGFPVNAGETLYAEAWLDASTANYTLNFGIYFVKADGSATTASPWTPVVARSAGAGWAFGSGSCTVPALAVKAYPWIQINGSSSLGTGRATLMRISRHQTGATVGATIGTNLSGQITSSNSSTFIGNQAINSVHISDLRTTNYAEDGSGNPTAGGKLASTGTAFKVAANSMQVGTQVLSDYWFRLLQGVDGNIANGRVIWRGNNDATTRGGAPNIACLSIIPKTTLVDFYDGSLDPNAKNTSSGSGRQSMYYNFKLTPTSYSGNSDNLDSMTQIHIQLFAKPIDVSPFIEVYQACPSRTYDGASGIVQGSLTFGFMFTGNTVYNASGVTAANPNLSGIAPNIVADYNSSSVYIWYYVGYMRARISNSYGWSATQDFGPTAHPPGSYQNNVALPTGTITGVAGSSGGGSGSQGGACPAPWVKVRLLNGKEVNASDLHNGAKLAAVNDSTMQAAPQGGTVRDLATIWAQRYRVKLTDGTATEWSENHRFAVVDRGWVQVQNLRAGDQIMGLKESVVESVLAVGEGQVVSFRVEGAGTYFAGGLLCHNTKTIT